MKTKLPLELLKKYNKPGPRYTSYPTYPSWKGITIDKWINNIEVAMKSNDHVAFYFHVPFCKTLCAFCGCNKEITKDYSKAYEYLDALEKEFQFYEELIPENKKLIVTEIHLGGGSPSWLKPEELKRLVNLVRCSSKLILSENLEQSIELDPRTTTPEHTETLLKLGFNRVSLGIQDTNDTVLQSIRRDQPYSMVCNVVKGLRDHGIKLLNMDLVYGLPFQTPETIVKTIDDVIKLAPSRLALYSYAHVPTLKPAQKLLERDGLPSAELKMEIAEIARLKLLENGYVEVGMDHFALPSDSLYKAFIENRIHRNFMGYTVMRSNVLIGLGPSSLSDTWTAFSQNEKDFDDWKNRVNANGHGVNFGHELTEWELLRRQEILDLMCRFKAIIPKKRMSPTQESLLQDLISDNLVVVDHTDNSIIATETGKHFIRNICMAFDDALLSQGVVPYSKTI